MKILTFTAGAALLIIPPIALVYLIAAFVCLDWLWWSEITRGDRIGVVWMVIVAVVLWSMGLWGFKAWAEENGKV